MMVHEKMVSNRRRNLAMLMQACSYVASPGLRVAPLLFELPRLGVNYQLTGCANPKNAKWNNFSGMAAVFLSSLSWLSARGT